MIYLGLKVEGWRFEGIVVWERQGKGEYSALWRVRGVFDKDGEARN